MNFNSAHFVKIIEGRKTKFYNYEDFSTGARNRKYSMNSISSAKVGLKDARHNLRKGS